MATLSSYYTNVHDHGVYGDGVHDDTAAIQRIIDRLEGAYTPSCGLLYLNGTFGATLFFPPGIYLITSALIITLAQTKFMGAGTQCTIFIFAPILDDGNQNVLFKFAKDDDTLLQQCGLADLSIQSIDTSMAKTAVYLRDSDAFFARNIYIGPWGGDLDGSIGIHMRGRHLTQLTGFHVTCDRPLIFSPTGYTYNGVADHFHVSDWASTCTDPNGKHIYAEPSTYLTHVTFDGYQAWSLGSHGFYWDIDEGLTPGIDLYGAVHLAFRNVRAELNHDLGTTDPGYAVYVNNTVQQLLVDNCFASTLAQGFWFNHINRLTLNACSYGYPQQSPPESEYVALHLGDDCDNVVLSNFEHMSPAQFETGTLVADRDIQSPFVTLTAGS
jgi:hypothetical protein